MRLHRRVAVAAVVGLSALLAATACSKQRRHDRRWRHGEQERRGLHLVGRRRREGRPRRPGQRSSARTAPATSSSTARSPVAPAPTPSRCSRPRLQQNDPPDTFQAHAGAELSDYINAGQVEDLSAEYKEWGLTNAFPKGLIDNLTVDGKIYSVPANIHRANVLWGNKTVLAGAGITKDADHAGRVLRRPGQAQGQGRHPAGARQGLDAADAVRVGAHHRPRRGQVHRAVERHDRLGRRRRHQGASATTRSC